MFLLEESSHRNEECRMPGAGVLLEYPLLFGYISAEQQGLSNHVDT